MANSHLVSVVVTVLNEEKSITRLLESLNSQTYPIADLIISDGGSTDTTESRILEFKHSHPQFPLRFIKAVGNRSVGRNTAIQQVSTKLIAITDAGCIPHRDWLAELVEKYTTENAGKDEQLVVAGYYDAKPKTGFEEAVVPYVLVMPDRVNPQDFLPATRSVLIEKRVWESVGAFNEKLRWNEDYDFAQKLRRNSIKIVFAAKAKVTWLPRENLVQFWKMIFHFAQGDVQAGIWRKKVMFIFARYLLGALTLLGLTAFEKYHLALGLLGVGGVLYLLWAFLKNRKYVKTGQLWLPVLQIVSDLAVMLGSLAGIISPL